MRAALFAGVAALSAAAALAQPLTPPPAGTLATTTEQHGVDAYGNRVDRSSSTYRDTNGVAQDKASTTTTVPALPPPPPPPPLATTTTTTTTETTGPK